MSFRRLAGYAGITMIIVLVVNVLLLGDQPTGSSSTEKVVDYITSDINTHKAALLVGTIVVPLFAIFLAGVVGQLRAADAASGDGWATVALVGGILLGASSVVGDALTGVLFLRGGEGLDTSVIVAINDGAAIAYSSIGLPIAVLTGAVAASTFRHRHHPNWYGWLSAAAAALGLLTLGGLMATSAALDALTFPALPAFAVWTIVTSVVLLRSPGSTEAPVVDRVMAGQSI